MKGKALNYDWSSLEMEYASSNLSLKEIAIKHNLSWSGLRSRANRFKWNRKTSASIIEEARKEVVQKVVNEKLEQIKELEAKSYRVSDKLISAVELSHDSMQGQPLDPPMIQGLSMSLKNSVAIAREALGIQDVQRVDVTSGGMHVQAMEILNTCAKLKEAGQLPSSDSLDIEALLLEHDQAKAGDEGK